MEKDRILVVEDNNTTAITLVGQLQKRGFNVDRVADGEQAIDHLIVPNPYMLVLLDIMLPNVSGIAVLRYVRERHKALELPVIMLTAKDKPEDVVGALRLGANDYVTKPIENDVLIARIKTQLELVRLSQVEAHKKELESIHALIVTYNHELNTPISVALNYLQLMKRTGTMDDIEKAIGGVERISKIVRSILKLSKESNINIRPYSATVNRIELPEPDEEDS